MAVTKFERMFQSSLRVPDSPWDGSEELQAFEDAMDAHVKQVEEGCGGGGGHATTSLLTHLPGEGA